MKKAKRKDFENKNKEDANTNKAGNGGNGQS